MRPAGRVAFGIVLACALILIARRVAAPPSLRSVAARSPAAVPVRASARLGESAPPIPSAPPWPSPDEGSDHGLLLARRCLSLAESDPLAAMEMAVANHLQNVDAGLFANLMIQWAREDFSGAYEWTKKQKSGAWRDDMLARFAFLRAQADPLAAARLVVADMSAGRARDEAIISVVHQWALQDLEAALLWAQSLANETLRQRAVAEVEGLADMPPKQEG